MPDNEKDRPSEGDPSVSMTVQTGHSLPPAAPDVAPGGKQLPTSMVDTTEQANEQKITTSIVGIDGLEGTRQAIDLIDYDALDRAEVARWDASLDETVAALIQFHRTIKGMRS